MADADAADAATIAVIAARPDVAAAGGNTEAADAMMIAIVAARRDNAAGRHRCCIILGRDDAPSHRTKFFVREPARCMCVVWVK